MDKTLKVKSKKALVKKNIKKISPASKKKKTKTQVSPNSLFFLRNLLENLIAKRDSYNLRAIIIISLSCFVFLYSFSQTNLGNPAKHTFSYLTFCVSSLIAALLSSLALKPPKIFYTWRNPSNSLMHHSGLKSFEFKDVYSRLKDIATDDEKIVDQYIMAIHLITERAIMRKKFFLIPAISFLVGGLIVGLITVFYLQ